MERAYLVQAVVPAAEEADSSYSRERAREGRHERDIFVNGGPNRGILSSILFRIGW